MHAWTLSSSDHNFGGTLRGLDMDAWVCRTSLYGVQKQKSETKMSATILKEDQNTWKKQTVCCHSKNKYKVFSESTGSGSVFLN